MKSFIKGERNKILLLILLGLLFILWGRIIAREIKINTYYENLTTLSKRIECVNFFGWDVDIGSETHEKIKIPETFDAVYEEYNRIQKLCGFDLTQYTGQTVTRYTYYVLNPPNDFKAPLYVNILIFENSLIGGDVMTTELDGTMLPLAKITE